jgi:hypothetical protein
VPSNKLAFKKNPKGDLIMKISITTIFLGLTTAASISMAQPSRTTFESVANEVKAPIENVFIPQGFDSNDNSEIVISGTFPNSCYKMGKTSHKYNEVEKKIFVEVNAYHIPSDYCLTITVPFLQVVQLGVLDKGKHPIVVNGIINSFIPISEAPADTEARDDHLYAPVYGLIQKKNALNTFEIQGVFPNACYELNRIEIQIETSKVVAVLPVMQKVEGCDEVENTKAVAWSERFEVSDDLKGKVLIHVRTLNGGSINQVVEL